MQRTYWYLNDNFDDGTSTKWNVVVVPNSDYNWYHPDLIYVSKTSGLSLISNRGKIKGSENPQKCDEDWVGNYKLLTNFTITGIRFSYRITSGKAACRYK